MKARTYYADTRPLEEPSVYSALYRRMPACRKEKADRFLFPKDRRLCVGAWALLRKALEDLGEDPDEIVIEAGSGGKPFLEGSWVCFNLSHSEERVACSVSDTDVGCDVEPVRYAGLDMAKAFFHGSEYDAIAAAQSTGGMPELFCRYWTLKESFMKATGLGMSLPLDSFRIDLGDQIRVEQRVDGREYRFKEYDPYDGYRCAVCSAGGGFEPSLRLTDLSDLARDRTIYRTTAMRRT
jgi:4'-phosphopantetheinyl transferase